MATLRRLLEEFTAGDPMRAGVLWTNLSLRELSGRLAGMGTPARRPAHDPPAAAPTEAGPPHGAEEEDDGPPPRPQRPVREHRPAAARVPGRGRPGDQRRHEEEGAAWELPPPG